MLTNIHFKNLTCFKDLELPFSCGLNIITGESGSGKSSILKAIYSLIRAQVFEDSDEPGEDPLIFKDSTIESRTCTFLELSFRTEGMNRLISQFVELGSHCELALNFADPDNDLTVDFYSRSHNRVKLIKSPSKVDSVFPFFFPHGDGLVLLPEFQKYTGSDRAHDDFHGVLYHYVKSVVGDETVHPFNNTPRGTQLHKLYHLLNDTVNGNVFTRDYRSFNIRPWSKKESRLLKKPTELSLLSDGLRKFAYLLILVENGSLSNIKYLFWDNPELYLDPKLLKVLAEVLLILSKAGIQVFIATQSLTLLREIDSQVNTSSYACVPTNFISLRHTYTKEHENDGEGATDSGPQYIGVQAKCANSLEELGKFILNEA